MSRFIVTAAVLAFSLGAAQAQTSKTPGTDSKPLLENSHMRVIEMLFKPGAKTSTLSHPNRFVYALTDGSLVFSPPGKTPYELSFKAGEALWLPAEAMVTMNDGDKEVRTLVVELKDMPRAVKVAGRGRHKGKLKGKGGTAKAAVIRAKKVAGKRG
jgi:beta-alanine degradation protein BauB